MCSSAQQCVAVLCSELQCVEKEWAMCTPYNTLQHTTLHRNTHKPRTSHYLRSPIRCLRSPFCDIVTHTVPHFNELQHTTTGLFVEKLSLGRALSWINVLKCVVRCSMLHCVASCCSNLQRVAACRSVHGLQGLFSEYALVWQYIFAQKNLS